MTIALVDSVAAVTLDSPVNLITATLPGGAPNPGDLLIADGKRDLSVGAAGGRLTRTGWTSISLQDVGPNLSKMELLWRVAQAGDPATMQFDWGGIGGSSSKRLFVSRWSGPWGVTPFDSESVGTFGVASPSQNHTPTSGVEGLIYVQACYQQGTAGAPGAGLTEIDDGFITGSSNPRCWAAHRIEASTSGTYACGLTWSNCCFSNSTLRVASFIATGGGGGGPTAGSQAIIIS